MNNNILPFPRHPKTKPPHQNISPIEIDQGVYGENIQLISTPEAYDDYSEEVSNFLLENKKFIQDVFHQASQYVSKNYSIVFRNHDLFSQIEFAGNIYIQYIEKTLLYLSRYHEEYFEYFQEDIGYIAEYIFGTYTYNRLEKNLLNEKSVYIPDNIIQKNKDPIQGDGLKEYYYNECISQEMIEIILEEGERVFRNQIKNYGGIPDTQESLSQIEEIIKSSKSDIILALESITSTLEFLVLHEEWELHISDEDVFLSIGEILEDFIYIIAEKLIENFFPEKE